MVICVDDVATNEKLPRTIGSFFRILFFFFFFAQNEIPLNIDESLNDSMIRNSPLIKLKGNQTKQEKKNNFHPKMN